MYLLPLMSIFILLQIMIILCLSMKLSNLWFPIFIVNTDVPISVSITRSTIVYNFNLLEGFQGSQFGTLLWGTNLWRGMQVYSCKRDLPKVSSVRKITSPKPPTRQLDGYVGDLIVRTPVFNCGEHYELQIQEPLILRFSMNNLSNVIYVLINNV